MKKIILILFLLAPFLIFLFRWKNDENCDKDFTYSYNDIRVKNGIPIIEDYFEKKYKNQNFCESQNWYSLDTNYFHTGKIVVSRNEVLLSETDYYRMSKDTSLIIVNDLIYKSREYYLETNKKKLKINNHLFLKLFKRGSVLN